MMKSRRSGILLHVTSLPSPFGIGDLGPAAYRFADFLFEAGQSIWQVLPLSPTSGICGNSPYCSYSAFAGNPLLISPEKLVEDGFLDPSDLEGRPPFGSDRVEYEAAAEYKLGLLWRAYERCKERKEKTSDFHRFCVENAHWLDDYALFVGLKHHQYGMLWSDWPTELRDRNEEALKDWGEKLAERVLAEKFFQHLFFHQWFALKKYCHAKNIQIMGDIPIYVSYDSHDVWTNTGIFKLNDEKRQTFVAGVPPDYFSATGQRWGNPVYDWDALKKSRYVWWVMRLAQNLKLYDLVRLDHFRGFVAYWEVPASEETAINGKWIKTPARDFFDTLSRRFPSLPIIAEDLGIITSDVREIMAAYEFPGMKILLFAFGDDLARNPYVPHNHQKNTVVYTGTHDNDTIRGWFREEANRGDVERLFRYLGRNVPEEEIHWTLIRLAMMSVANTVIIPLQDALGLGAEARMNMPSVTYGNWEWRVPADLLTEGLAKALLEITQLYGRV